MMKEQVGRRILLMSFAALTGCATSGGGYNGMDPYEKPMTIQGKTIIPSNETLHSDERMPSESIP